MYYKVVYPETDKKVEERFLKELQEKFFQGKLEFIPLDFMHCLIKESGEVIAEIYKFVE